MLRRISGFIFLFCIFAALVQCGRRGNPSGGEKDITPPVLLRADPQNLSTNFKAKKIRLYFDEYVTLSDVQNQLIVSPPLKYLPQITPQGSARKYVDIVIKDTLKENTTYTFNFGQSIQDNNEGNPASFLTYVFSTGDFIDSLSITGVVKDAFKKETDNFVSVMLYEIDSAYTDSVIFKKPPNYITNTLDSTIIFELKNLKAGKYRLFGLKDAGKNNVFDQNIDKIAFLKDTITVPTDSVFLLSLFNEIPNYSAAIPSYASKNRIIFGYTGKEPPIIRPLTQLPDTVQTMITKERDKDTLNFWFTPFETDSLVFTVTPKNEQTIDTFTVKTRKLGLDTLSIQPVQRGNLGFDETFSINANTPLVALDTALIQIIDTDSIAVPYTAKIDSLRNSIGINFEVNPSQRYRIDLYQGAVTDFYGTVNDSVNYQLSTGSFADYGNLTFSLAGAVTYPLILQLTDESGRIEREIYATEPKLFVFNHLEPSTYFARVIFDDNANRQWDTGNYLKKIQPEKTSYYPKEIEVRANWELNETFTISN